MCQKVPKELANKVEGTVEQTDTIADGGDNHKVSDLDEEVAAAKEDTKWESVTQITTEINDTWFGGVLRIINLNVHYVLLWLNLLP